MAARTLASIQHGWGQLQTPTQACLPQAKVLSPAPSQLFQLTVLGRPAQGPLSGAARDLTSSTLWLIGHRWGPERDGNPAAPRVPCSSASPPSQAAKPEQEGPVRLGWRLNQGFPFSPRALHRLTAQWMMTGQALVTTVHHGFLPLGLWKGWASQEAAGCHGNTRFGRGSTL